MVDHSMVIADGRFKSEWKCMANVRNGGEGSFGFETKDENGNIDVAWFHTKAGRDRVLKDLKLIGPPGKKFTKVQRMG